MTGCIYSNDCKELGCRKCKMNCKNIKSCRKAGVAWPGRTIRTDLSNQLVTLRLLGQANELPDDFRLNDLNNMPR